MSRHLTCTPEAVFAVLQDGWLYATWVVGASRIRDVDADWPAVGTRIHHSVGSWPLLLDDITLCEEYEPDRRMRLRARAWPAGEADVLIEVTSAPWGTTVTMTEDAVKGPGTFIPKPVRSLLLKGRNTETLRRLALIAENRHH